MNKDTDNILSEDNLKKLGLVHVDANSDGIYFTFFEMFSNDNLYVLAKWNENNNNFDINYKIGFGQEYDKKSKSVSMKELLNTVCSKNIMKKLLKSMIYDKNNINFIVECIKNNVITKKDLRKMYNKEQEPIYESANDNNILSNIKNGKYGEILYTDESVGLNWIDVEVTMTNENKIYLTIEWRYDEDKFSVSYKFYEYDDYIESELVSMKDLLEDEFCSKEAFLRLLNYMSAEDVLDMSYVLECVKNNIISKDEIDEYYSDNDIVVEHVLNESVSSFTELVDKITANYIDKEEDIIESRTIIVIYNVKDYNYILEFRWETDKFNVNCTKNMYSYDDEDNEEFNEEIIWSGYCSFEEALMCCSKEILANSAKYMNSVNDSDTNFILNCIKYNVISSEEAKKIMSNDEKDIINESDNSSQYNVIIKYIGLLKDNENLSQEEYAEKLKSMNFKKVESDIKSAPIKFKNDDDDIMVFYFIPVVGWTVNVIVMGSAPIIKRKVDYKFVRQFCSVSDILNYIDPDDNKEELFDLYKKNMVDKVVFQVLKGYEDPEEL